jgi:purine-binding chemotaxis protein CheW
LPELTAAEEVPPWIAGFFNLRGRIVPVADLHLRFGHPARHYSPDDQVVVLEADDLLMGLIVSEVREVIELPCGAIQQQPQFETEALGPGHLVTGKARVGDDIVTLLDVSLLKHLPERATPADAACRSASASYFSPESPPETRALFHARAVALREAIIEEEGVRLGLAVVELGDEYFGIELAAVQEFCNITLLSPIPCCPPHILGAMNLRGDLLILIDPRTALNLPPTAGGGGKAVVTRHGDRMVGIAVDAVHGVVYLPGKELQPPPPLHEAEIKGFAPYTGRMMTVLDLPTLLAREEWIVNEHV